MIEYLQYPNPAGLKPVTVDQSCRAKSTTVPEPPPRRGPRGADRIKILEDTDGDGKADKETIFAEGLNLASGLAVGYGGVFVGQGRTCCSIPIKTRMTSRTGIPKFCFRASACKTRATMNSMQFGPDGWLYGTQGSTVTARVRL